MAINETLLALALDELNDTNKNISTQRRVIEHLVGRNRKMESIK
jgi:hypothetical protein